MKVAIFTGPEGHLSIAQAIEQWLKPHHHVVTFYDRNELFALYTPIYQLFPLAHKLPYTLSQSQMTLKAMRDIFKLKFEKKLEQFYTQHRPDVCISTYFMYNPNLERFQELAHTPFINIITDPKSIHPMLVSEKAQSNLVFDLAAQQRCHELCPAGTHTISGWLVRPQFKPVASKLPVRRKLKLDTKLFTILITAGSEGTMMIAKLVPALLRLSKPTQIIVTAGNNNSLFRSMQTFSKVLKRINPNSRLIPLKFVTNMHEYMQAADLVVGKAGPNTLFESVATHTPFVAVTHIPGQEDGNLDVIREYKLGFVEENAFRAMWLLKELIEEPEKLQPFAEPIQKLAAHNAQAVTTLEQLLLSKAKTK